MKREGRGIAAKKNKLETKATTTPLVRNVFEMFFTDQIAQSEKADQVILFILLHQFLCIQTI